MALLCLSPSWPSIPESTADQDQDHDQHESSEDSTDRTTNMVRCSCTKTNSWWTLLQCPIEPLDPQIALETQHGTGPVEDVEDALLPHLVVQGWDPATNTTEVAWMT